MTDNARLPEREIRTAITSRHPKVFAAMEQLLRLLVAALAACGINLFFYNALGFEASLLTVLLPVLLWMTVLFLLFRSKRGAIAGISLLAVIFIVLYLKTECNPLRYLAGGAAGIWNRFMQVIDGLGFVSLPQIGTELYRSEFASLFFVSLFSCTVFYLSVRKKTRLLPFSCFLALLCSPVFIYNMLSSNAGICLLLTALAGASAMKVSEKHAGAPTPSGYAGFAAMLLSALILIVPALSIKQPWSDMSSISDKIEAIRQIVTDLAEGKPISFANFGGSDSLNARDTTASRRVFRDKLMFRLYSDIKAPIYLRSWIGADFEDSQWSAPNLQGVDLRYDDVLSYPDSPHIVTENFIYLFDSATEENAAKQLGLVSSDIRITPASGGQLMPVPYMVSSSLASPGSSIFKPGYERINDGIYVTSRLSKKESYEMSALVPISRIGTSRDMLSVYLSAYLKFSNAEKNGGGYISLKGNQYAEMLYKNFAHSDAADAILKRNDAYTLLAETLYSDLPSSDVIDTIVEDIFETTDIAKYYKRYGFDDDTYTQYPQNGVIVTTDERGNSDTYYLSSEGEILYTDDIARLVIDYLCSRCSYSLNPAKPTSKDSMEEFLLISKEGYCVQFATAATLIMRRLGFSARYAEGYIVQDFKRNEDNSDYTYAAKVIDRNAHAWMEIWISGYGWMQYEATPGFTDSVYTTEYPPDTTDTPDDTTTPPDTTEPPQTQDTDSGDSSDNTSKPSDSASELPGTTEPGTSDDPGSDTQNLSLLLIFLSVAAVILLTAVLLLQRSTKKRNARLKQLNRALDALSLDSAECSRLGQALCEMLSKILAAYGLVPTLGELPSAFAERAEKTLSSLALPESLSRAIGGMQKQIYGNGMSADDLAVSASIILALSDRAKKRLGWFRFLWYRHILCIL